MTIFFVTDDNGNKKLMQYGRQNYIQIVASSFKEATRKYIEWFTSEPFVDIDLTCFPEECVFYVTGLSAGKLVTREYLLFVRKSVSIKQKISKKKK